MISHKNNYRSYDSNAVFETALLSVIGDREEQQDSAGFELKNDEGVVIVCDGMGGHEGGKTASTLATELFLKSYLEEYPCGDLHSWLIDMAVEADRKIAALKSENGPLLKAGSTAAAVCIRKKTLCWLAVGDSRIYICRGDELARVTNDHNYKALLDAQLENEQIDPDAYAEGMENGEALISFLGINGLPLIESNSSPFELKRGDRIVLATDGLHRLVSEEEMERIINNFENIEDTLSALEMKARKNGKFVSRDNLTVAIIKIL